MHKKTIFAVVIIFSVLSISLLIYSYVLASKKDSITTPTEQKPSEFISTQLKETAFTVLIVGVDSRGTYEAGRADSIIIARFDTNSGTATLLSIPRDSRVTYFGHGFMDKINATMNSAYVKDGGIELLGHTIESMMPGLKIDYYVKARFDGFAKAVDLLGGIDYNVEKNMYYRSADTLIDLKSGQQHLSGEQVLDYMRFRHDGAGDFAISGTTEAGRVSRQKKMVSAIIKKATSISMLPKLSSIVHSAGQYIETNISVSDAIHYATELIGKKISIVTIPFPTDDIKTVYENGFPKSYVFPDFKALATSTVAEFLGNN